MGLVNRPHQEERGVTINMDLGKPYEALHAADTSRVALATLHSQLESHFADNPYISIVREGDTLNAVDRKLELGYDHLAPVVRVSLQETQTGSSIRITSPLREVEPTFPLTFHPIFQYVRDQLPSIAGSDKIFDEAYSGGVVAALESIKNPLMPALSLRETHRTVPEVGFKIAPHAIESLQRFETEYGGVALAQFLAQNGLSWCMRFIPPERLITAIPETSAVFMTNGSSIGQIVEKKVTNYIKKEGRLASPTLSAALTRHALVCDEDQFERVTGIIHRLNNPRMVVENALEFVNSQATAERAVTIFQPYAEELGRNLAQTFDTRGSWSGYVAGSVFGSPNDFQEQLIRPLIGVDLQPQFRNGFYRGVARRYTGYHRTTMSPLVMEIGIATEEGQQLVGRDFLSRLEGTDSLSRRITLLFDHLLLNKLPCHGVMREFLSNDQMCQGFADGLRDELTFRARFFEAFDTSMDRDNALRLLPAVLRTQNFPLIGGNNELARLCNAAGPDCIEVLTAALPTEIPRDDSASSRFAVGVLSVLRQALSMRDTTTAGATFESLIDPLIAEQARTVLERNGA